MQNHSGTKALLLLTFLVIAGFSISAVSGCSSGRENLADRGTSHAYQVGHPEVLARVTSFFDDEGHPIAELHMELPHQNLVFRTLENRRFANVEITGQLRPANGGLEVAGRFREELEIDITGDRSSYTTYYDRSTRLEPGSYQLELSVRDISSNKRTNLLLEVNIPDPESAVASVSDIKVITRGDGEEQTTSSYLVPASRDSLSFEFYVTRSGEDIPAEVKMRLIRFRSDTEPARAMGHLPISAGNIAYRGIDYNEREEISTQNRTLDTETGPVQIDYSVPRPESGNYRFEIELISADSAGVETSSTRFRDFALVSPNFPRVQSTREMAEPLVYLMREREFRNMIRIEDTDSLRLDVERFWLRDMTASTARDQIQRYYSRVEDANRLFSNFKEGWKTDMGMVYILLGPPLYVERNIDHIIWHYSYNRMDPSTVIVFERARITSSAWPFSHYILARNRFYQSIELERIGDWTSGRTPRIN